MPSREKGCFDPLTFEQHAEVVLSFARVLFVNGQATDQTVVVAERVCKALGLKARVIPQWGVLQLVAVVHNDRRTFEIIANPSDVDMDRVVRAMQAAEQLHRAQLGPSRPSRK